jgi:large subunit ribosomal protein L29
MIDIKDIRDKKIKDLQKMLDDLLDEQMKLRLQFVTGQVTNSSQFKKMRKDIARLRTVLGEQKNDN